MHFARIFAKYTIIFVLFIFLYIIRCLIQSCFKWTRFTRCSSKSRTSSRFKLQYRINSYKLFKSISVVVSTTVIWLVTYTTTRSTVFTVILLEHLNERKRILQMFELNGQRLIFQLLVKSYCYISLQ